MLEVANVALGEEGYTLFVLGFAYQELEREGVGVLTAGVFLGAFPFGGGEWGDPHHDYVAGFQFDFFLYGVEAGSFL